MIILITLLYTCIMVQMSRSGRKSTKVIEKPWTEEDNKLFDGIVRNRPKLWAKEHKDNKKEKSVEFERIAATMGRSG